MMRTGTDRGDWCIRLNEFLLNILSFADYKLTHCCIFQFLLLIFHVFSYDIWSTDPFHQCDWNLRLNLSLLIVYHEYCCQLGTEHLLSPGKPNFHFSIFWPWTPPSPLFPSLRLLHPWSSCSNDHCRTSGGQSGWVFNSRTAGGRSKMCVRAALTLWLICSAVSTSACVRAWREG